MPDEKTKIQCPHCSNLIVFTRGKRGKWIGRVVGGVGGGWIGSSLGIAGGIFGISVAASFTIPALIIGAIAGDQVGKEVQQGPLPRVWQENKMSKDKDVKQIVPDMSEFEIDDVVSILMGSTPDSEIQIEYEDEGSEEESEN